MPSDHTSAFSLTRSGLLTSSGAMYGNVPLQAGDTLNTEQDRQAPKGPPSSTWPSWGQHSIGAAVE